MDLVTIKITNYEKYRGRSDVKNHSWFRCSNRILEDHELFDFTHEEVCVWIYFLSIASQKNHDVIHVSHQHAHHVCKLSKNAITSAIQKLKKIGAIEVPRTRTLRGRYACDTHPCATEQNRTYRTEQDRTGEVGQVRPPDAKAVETGAEILAIIPEAIKSTWPTLYPDDGFVTREAHKASNWCNVNPARKPKTVRGWSRFFSGWLERGWPNYQKSIPANRPETSIGDLSHVKWDDEVTA